MQQLCRACLDRLLKDLNLALMVQGHVPDREASLRITYRHVDLLVFTGANLLDAVDGHLRLLEDVLGEVLD